MLHLKLRKFRLAAFSFSKALKFLEVAPNSNLPNSQEMANQPFAS
jgi:hypothetical protein